MAYAQAGPARVVAPSPAGQSWACRAIQRNQYGTPPGLPSLDRGEEENIYRKFN